MSLFDLPTLASYLAAATVLVLLPGPGTAWIRLSHSLVLSVAVGRLGHRLRLHAGRWQQRATGTVFVALGVRLALQQR